MALFFCSKKKIPREFPVPKPIKLKTAIDVREIKDATPKSEVLSFDVKSGSNRSELKR